jgi:TRAP-type C4-dicarboxylate transport system permease small subunit
VDIKERADKIIEFIAHQWYIFQIGMQYLGVATFTLVAINQAEKIMKWLGVGRTIYYLALLFLFVMICVFCLGKILDYLKMNQRMDRQNLERSITWAEAYKRFDAIDKKLDKLLEGKE